MDLGPPEGIAALRHAALKRCSVDVSTSANVRNVCSFLNSRHYVRLTSDSGRKNFARLTWDKIAGSLEGTKSFQDEDEEDDTLERVRHTKEQILAPGVHGETV
jgi:hypothetical protein